METKEIKTMEIAKAVEKINGLINPVSYAVIVIETGDILAIYRYKVAAEKWLKQYMTTGGFEIVRIDLDGSNLSLKPINKF